MVEKVIKGLILGACIGVVAYILLKDMVLSIILGGVWCMAMLVPKKKG